MQSLILTELDRDHCSDSCDLKTAEYLGPWCLRKYKSKNESYFTYNDLRQYINRFGIYPDKSISSVRFNDVVNYTNNCLDALVVYLNSMHNVSYSYKFWEILLREWVYWIVETVLDRWDRIESKLDRGPFKVSVFCKNTTMHFKVSAEKMNAMDSEINLFFISRILLELSPKNWQFNYLPARKLIIGDDTTQLIRIGRFDIWNRAKRIKWRIQDKINRYEHEWTKEQIYKKGILILEDHHLDTSDLKKMLRLIGNRSVKKTSSVKNDLKEIGVGTSIPKDNNKYSFLIDLMKEILPNYVTADFNKYNSAAKKIWRRKHIKSFGCMIGTPMARFRVAFGTEFADASFIGVQHGSNYGTAKNFACISEIEYRNVDRFLTWGWTKDDVNYTELKPIPSTRLSKLKNSRKRLNDHLIFTGALMFPCYYHTGRVLHSERILEYLDQKIDFVTSLSKEVKSNLLYRPHYSGKNPIDEELFAREHLGNVGILQGELTNHLLGCKLYVTDHPGTSTLVALAADVPSLMVYKEHMFPSTSQFSVVLKELERINYYFRNATEAAHFVNKNWSNVEQWWEDTKKNNAFVDFVNQYALTSDNWLEALTDELVAG